MEQYLFNVAEAADPVDGVVEVRSNLWLMSAEEIPPLLFTIEEAAKILHVGRPAMFRLIHEKTLRSIKVGASRRISARALSEFVATAETGALS